MHVTQVQLHRDAIVAALNITVVVVPGVSQTMVRPHAHVAA